MNETQMKYIRKGIGAGGLAALLAIMANGNGKVVKKNVRNPLSSSDTIVVPIRKENFLKGLPTPDEFAKSHDNTPLLENKDDSAKSKVANMSKSEIEAKKKELLRNASKHINFFKKSAEKTEVPQSDDWQKSQDKSKSDEKSSKETSEDKGNGGVDLPRNDLGQFVSPTDPVAVKPAEKEAGVMDYAKRPAALALGGATAIYIANLIVDAVNKRRANDSDKALKAEQDKYVNLVQETSNVKKAQWNLGELVAGTFVIPASVTAMVTHRIIENRKAEKKKAKESVDSYPKEPTILYKVV